MYAVSRRVHYLIMHAAGLNNNARMHSQLHVQLAPVPRGQAVDDVGYSHGGGHSYTFNTVIRWTRLTRQTSKVVGFFVFIRQYARICLYMKRHDLGQNPTELLVTSLVCKVGLFYSSVSINQLFNTKNSFLQLFSRKATLKC